MNAALLKVPVSVLLVSLIALLFTALSFPAHVFADCTYADGGVAPCGSYPDFSTVPGTSGGSGTPQGGGNVTPQGGGNVTPQGAGGGTAGTYTITNPLNGINSVSDFVQKLLKAVVQIGVPICVLFIILAGFKFITAQGNAEQLAAARRNFIHVVIGVAIFIGAWALATLIANTLRNIGVNV